MISELIALKMYDIAKYGNTRPYNVYYFYCTIRFIYVKMDREIVPKHEINPLHVAHPMLRLC